MEMLLTTPKDERIGSRRIKRKEPGPGPLNNRADRKLTFVADMFTVAMGDNFLELKKTILHREIICRGYRYLTNLSLDYDKYVKRIWARVWELFFKTTFDVSGYSESENEKCHFVAVNKGKWSINDAEWIDRGSSCSTEKTKKYLELLNNKLIIERMVMLDMVDAEIIFSPRNRTWTVKYKSVIGSTNWIMIPPITQLIKHKPYEVIRTIEFFELVLDALVNVKKAEKVS